MDPIQEHTHHHHDSQDKATKISIFLSLLCTLHCILTPILLVFIGMYPAINASFNVLNNPILELSIILFSGLLGIYTMLHGYKHHHRESKPIILFSIGIFLFCLHFGLHLLLFSEGINLGISLIGSLFILWSQVLNYRLMNRTKCVD